MTISSKAWSNTYINRNRPFTPISPIQSKSPSAALRVDILPPYRIGSTKSAVSPAAAINCLEEFMAQWHWREWITDPEQRRRLQLLARVPLFAGLSRRQLGKLLVKLFEKRYEANETIFREGDPGKALFVVLDGKISIARAADGSEKPLALLGPGAYFGELALIDDQPRFAGARADDETVLLILYKSHFDDLIEGQKALAIQVMENLLKTLASYVRAEQSRSALRAAKSGAVSIAEQSAIAVERTRR